MFLLSEILKGMNFDDKYQINNEKPFKYLALTASELNETFCVFIDNIKFTSVIPEHVSMILTTDDVADAIDNSLYGICIVENPRELFFKIHNFLCNDKKYLRTIYNTIIGDNCSISKHAVISDHNVTVGDNVIIEEFVVIRENTVIGDNAIIRSGTIIGGTGFEAKRVKSGTLSVIHAGGVILGNNVEIQYNTCIDKGVYPWDDTQISDFCKIDNLVQIAHGVKLKENVLIAASACIAGRTVIGKDSWIGLGATIINGIQVGDKSRINIGSVVLRNVKPNSSVIGNPANKIDKYSKIQFKLGELIRNL